MDFKDIHIGQMIEKKVIENEIEILRICNFMRCTKRDIEQMYKSKSLDTELLLRWSKLLEYDFFRIYSHHLILYAPVSKDKKESVKSILPQFRKNIYTQEIIDFILERIQTGEMTKKDVIYEYKIPKTTLYKWLNKRKLTD
ncbi:transposase [Empedobacter falsenii]